MKKLPWLLFLLTLFACSEHVATPTIVSPVTDLANVLTPAQEEDLARRLRAHREETQVQIALLTIPTTGDESIEVFSLRAARAWGGGQANADNGVLVTLAMNDRHSRIELGRGVAPSIPEATSVYLLHGARPYLRNNDVAGAFSYLIDGLTSRTRELRLSNATNAPPLMSPIPDAPQPASNTGLLIGLFFLVPVLVTAGVWFLRKMDDRGKPYVEQWQEEQMTRRRAQEAEARRVQDQERIIRAAEAQARRDVEEKARRESAQRAHEAHLAKLAERARMKAAAEADDATEEAQMAWAATLAIEESERAAREEASRQAAEAARAAEQARQAAVAQAEAARLAAKSSHSSKRAASRRDEDDDSSSSSSSSSSWWDSSSSSSSSSDYSGGGGDFGGGGGSSDW